MNEAFPERIAKITNRIREVRGGKLTEGEFFKRHQGTGTYWAMIEQLFEVAKRKAGFPAENAQAIPTTFTRPGVEQATLF